MPVYEYRCTECEGHTTRMRRMSDRHARTFCPECGERMELIISRPSGHPDGIYSYDENVGDPNLAEPGYKAERIAKLGA